MSAEVSYLISSSINIFIMVATNWGLQLYSYLHLLKRRHSMIPFFIQALLKTLVYNIFISNILMYYYQDAKWINPLSFAVYWMYVFIYVSISVWTFDEDFQRIFVTLFLVELPIASYNVLLSAVINAILGRKDSWIYFHKFEWRVLLLFVIASGVCIILMNLILPFFRKLLDRLLVFRKTLWVVTFIYLNMGCFSWVFTEDFSVVSLLIFFWFGTFLAGILYFVQKYTTNTRKKNIFLKEQKNLIELHYATVIRQVAQMRKSRKLMAQQMEEIAVITDQEIKKKKLADYTLQVKQSYGEIQAGIYCDDWIIDSILYNKKEELDKQGITFDISLQGYDRGRIEENDLAGILITLFKVDKKELEDGNKKQNLHLKIQRIKGQLFLECTILNAKKSKELKKKIKPYLKKYHGNCIVTEKQGEDVAVIHLLAV